MTSTENTDIGPFEEPVHLETEAGERDVATTLEAAAMLLYDWPIGETGIRMHARMTCMKVLAGSKPPVSARNAFIDAAKEAKILAEA